jgi:hypothetical protein
MTMLKKNAATILLMGLGLIASDTRASADAVTDWNEVASRAYVAAGVGNLKGQRVITIMHIAIHDALNDIDRRYQTYAVNAYARPNASPDAAVAAAAHAVLTATLPTQRSLLDEELARTMSQIADGDPKNQGMLLGVRVAQAILGLRIADGAELTVPYTATSRPGSWQPTPPAFLPALLPNWAQVTPFALVRTSQFRPWGPPELSSRTYARDFNEVKSIGSINSTTRTAEQSEIARFWYEGSPITWNRIARDVASERALDLWENARLFALMNIAMADGWVAGWDAKFHFDFWRPVTAIQKADLDGNAATSADPEWAAFLLVPNHPDYLSTHSVLGGAASAVLALFFDDDDISFTLTTSTAPEVTRQFRSFSHAAVENADSRVFAGLHFRSACVDGTRVGRQIGRHVFRHQFRPVPR